MGLEHADDPLPPAVDRRRQGGTDLGGQVGVVVDIGDAVALAAELEAAGHAPVAAKDVGCNLRVDSHLDRHDESGESVEGVVGAGHGELDVDQGSTAVFDPVAAAGSAGLETDHAVVNALAAAVGDTAARGDKASGDDVVAAHDTRALDAAEKM